METNMEEIRPFKHGLLLLLAYEKKRRTIAFCIKACTHCSQLFWSDWSYAMLLFVQFTDKGSRFTISIFHTKLNLDKV